MCWATQARPRPNFVVKASSELKPHRSFLFVPGVRKDFFHTASKAAADCLLFDLEDSVPPKMKEAARRNLEPFLETVHPTPTYVRVNSVHSSEHSGDLQAVARAGVRGVFIPKCESPQDVLAVDTGLA